MIAKMNRTVAKLPENTPIKWSESGIGVIALDNAIDAGHLIYVETGDENEYWIMRASADQIAQMVPTVNRFGKTVYSFISSKETEMQTETTTTAAEIAAVVPSLVERADDALAAFVVDVLSYDSLADQIADLLAGLHILAANANVDWKKVISDGAQRYHETAKAAKPARQPKAAAAPQKARPVDGTQYRVTVQGPDGVIESVQPKPYAFAVLVRENGVWTAKSWCSTKVVAYSRANAWRGRGFAKDEVVIFDATSEQIDGELEAIKATAEFAAYKARAEAEPPAASFASQIAPVVETAAETEPLPFEPTAADVEIEREAEVEEPMHVKIVGGAAVHYSDDGDDTFCGLGSRNYVQTPDAEVTCKNCKIVAKARANAA